MTLKQWKLAVLAYLGTNAASNGPAEAIEGVTETTRRITRGLRNFTNSRLRMLSSIGHIKY